MKLVLPVIVALILIILMPVTALKTQVPEPSFVAKVTESVDAENAPVLVDKKLGDDYIAVTGAYLSKDYDDTPCIMVCFRWSHKVPLGATFDQRFNWQLTQNGQPLSRVVDPPDFDPNQHTYDKAPQRKNDVQIAYILRDLTSRVDVQISSGGGSMDFGFELQQ